MEHEIWSGLRSANIADTATIACSSQVPNKDANNLSLTQSSYLLEAAGT
jgi:hypothetical protein